MNICIACKEPITAGATKCPHCQSHQQIWRRYASLLTATSAFTLTAITIYLAPPIKEIFDVKKPDIRVSIIGSTLKDVTFMIANVGNQAAAITSIELKEQTPTGPAFHFLKSNIDGGLLEPGRVQIAKAENGFIVPEALSPEVKEALQMRHYSPPINCGLVVQYFQLDGSKIYMTHPFACTPVDRSDKKSPLE